LSKDWTTRVLPELTSQYGVGELHTVWLLPKGWPGKGPAVSLTLLHSTEAPLLCSATPHTPIRGGGGAEALLNLLHPCSTQVEQVEQLWNMT
jgi:hypothetical protein